MWKNPRFWKRVLAIVGMLVLVGLAVHPELRLLVPFLDAIGFDALLALLGAQALSIFSDTLVPVLTGAWRRIAPWLLALDRATSSRNLAGAIRAAGARVFSGYGGCVCQYLWVRCGQFWRMACLGPDGRAGGPPSMPDMAGCGL